MTHLEETFLKAVKVLVAEQGMTVEEAKKEVKFAMNVICDILEKNNEANK